MVNGRRRLTRKIFVDRRGGEGSEVSPIKALRVAARAG